jgi:hypothetical protein
MFIGSYYPRNDQTGFCSRGNGAPFLAAEWKIGAGTASCSDTLGCIVAASSKNSGQVAPGASGVALTTNITECLLASRADQVGPVSDMLGCLAGAPSSANPLELCASEIDTCRSL